MTAAKSAVVFLLLLGDPVASRAESRCLPGDRLLDGGFEASAGDPAFSPAWSETSTNFFSPLCTGSYCGRGSRGVVAASGTYFAWFGGALQPETASLTQTVVLPPSATALLRFKLRRLGSEPLTDTLAVEMDAVQLATIPEAADEECCYSAFTYPLDSFADGEAHTLRFTYTGLGANVSTFALDEVSVEVTACLPGLLFGDGFESGSAAAWSTSVP